MSKRPLPPVLLLHGLATSAARTWGENGWLDLLADADREVIALDLMGHGDNVKPHDPEAYEALEQDVVDRLPDGPARCGRLLARRSDHPGHRCAATREVPQDRHRRRRQEPLRRRPRPGGVDPARPRRHPRRRGPVVAVLQPARRVTRGRPSRAVGPGPAEEGVARHARSPQGNHRAGVGLHRRRRLGRPR